MSSSIYGFSANLVGASTGAYVSITFSAGKSATSSFSATPRDATYVFYSDEGSSLTWQAGAGAAGAGAAVDADGSVAGSIIISPPVDVPLEIVLHGQGGIIGRHVTPAGQSQDSFNIPVNVSDALSEDEVNAFVKKGAPK